ncbi:hypothetical protein B0T18DRAFT_424740 [Schizothecium vesticola]|uniref:Uncharacterized protein n=1 Tax=Schizothecium vesticola TaxID=314040 RepID=A0AA40FAS0_9PEZI|nr:hypothetical protein B0T18DRAFT_424740 [Schizothecium vesticola]
MSPSGILPRVVIVALLVMIGAEAHMIMRHPVPYNLDVDPKVQVDPLGESNPFPCQNRATVQTRTDINAGGATLVQFTGGAQHGGGSCQFSISYDDPSHGGWNTSAKFKTVYTIIGGCPAIFTDESRNLPPAKPDQDGRANTAECFNDFGVDCTRQFLVPLPSFLRNGPATFAWTYFNKLGNREMYMTCSPVNIRGGTADQFQINALPDIFVANVPSASDCTTGTAGDRVVLNIPNPGVHGRVLQPPGEPAVKPSNYCVDIPPKDRPPVFIQNDPRTIQTQGMGQTSTLSEETTTTLPPVTKTVTGTRYFTVVTVTATGVATGPVKCSKEGELICFGTDEFGICSFGEATPQKVAEGTKIDSD